jgi:hypothetical protein
MENAPVLEMVFIQFAPGTEDDTVTRYMNWVNEVNNPLLMKPAGVTGSESYIIIHKSPEYPSHGIMRHFENVVAYENFLKSSERLAVVEDRNSWVRRGVREGIWWAAYELVQGFRAGAASTGIKKDTTIENAPFMHIEACRLTTEEQGKYNRWFNEYSQVFMPLFVKNCGLKGYDYLKDVGDDHLKDIGQVPSFPSKEREYPPYISVLYFEDLKAFQHFEESLEQVSFQRALRNVFPLGFMYKWYVQYQLQKSWRK